MISKLALRDIMTARLRDIVEAMEIVGECSGSCPICGEKIAPNYLPYSAA